MNEAGHVEVVASPPGMIEDVRKQDVLTTGDRIGFDTQKRQQSRD